jgi:hypothetical protein
MKAFVRRCERPAAGCVVGGAKSLSPRLPSSARRAEERVALALPAISVLTAGMSRKAVMSLESSDLEDWQLGGRRAQLGDALGFPLFQHASLLLLDLCDLGVRFADHSVGFVHVDGAGA